MDTRKYYCNIFGVNVSTLATPCKILAIVVATGDKVQNEVPNGGKGHALGTNNLIVGVAPIVAFRRFSTSSRLG